MGEAAPQPERGDSPPGWEGRRSLPWEAPALVGRMDTHMLGENSGPTVGTWEHALILRRLERG